MQDKLEKALVEIGLSEKEAKVYLASLALGPATAQSIAAKAMVSRPSTYIMIESLKKRSLMSEFVRGKRNFFSSSSPNQLSYIIKSQKRALVEKENALDTVITALAKVSNISEFDVQVFDGIDGIIQMQEMILQTPKGEDILELVSVDEARKFIPEITGVDLRNEIAAKHKIKVLYTISSGPVRDKSSNVEHKLLPNNKYNFSGQLVIFGDRVALTSFDSKTVTVVINCHSIAVTMRAILMGLWKSEN
jgi:sugar-specific transcriptional regulator TrmB